MSLFEFTEEEFVKMHRDEAKEEGIKVGIEKERLEFLLESVGNIANVLSSKGTVTDELKSQISSINSRKTMDAALMAAVEAKSVEEFKEKLAKLE